MGDYGISGEWMVRGRCGGGGNLRGSPEGHHHGCHHRDVIQYRLHDDAHNSAHLHSQQPHTIICHTACRTACGSIGSIMVDARNSQSATSSFTLFRRWMMARLPMNLQCAASWNMCSKDAAVTLGSSGIERWQRTLKLVTLGTMRNRLPRLIMGSMARAMLASPAQRKPACTHTKLPPYLEKPHLKPPARRRRRGGRGGGDSDTPKVS